MTDIYENNVVYQRSDGSLLTVSNIPYFSPRPESGRGGRPTHFLSLPLTTNESIPQWTESLAYFRSVTTPLEPEDGGSQQATHGGTSVLPNSTASARPAGNIAGPAASGSRSEGIEGNLRLIPPAAHRPPGTMHLTVGVMDLSDTVSMVYALRLLQQVDYAALLRAAEAGRLPGQTESSSPAPTTPTPLTVTMSGLGTFPRPDSSRVFYANAHDPTSRLFPFANAIRSKFQDAGLITETRPLLLHATVAKLAYVRRRHRSFSRSETEQHEQASMVDARDILRHINEGLAESSQNSSRLNGTATSAPSASDQNTSSTGSGGETGTGREFVWAKDIKIDRVQLCKMGPEVSSKEGWGLEYVSIAEKVFSS